MARNYRSGYCWLIDGSYKHGMAIITPGDYGEDRIKTTVVKIVIYRAEEAIGKGRWNTMSWKLEEGNVEQLLISGSHSQACTGIAQGLVTT